MALWMTKVWGFDIPAGPLQFSRPGDRTNALRDLKPGDKVVLVGTMNAGHTVEADRGKILGIVEPTNRLVRSLDFDIARHPNDMEDGSFKWPHGIHISRAWRVLEPPLLSDVTVRKFGQNSATAIVQLTEIEAEQIQRLEIEEVERLQPWQAIDPDDGRGGGAPPPSTQRNGVMHMRTACASTYAFWIEHASGPAIKVGWAFDPESRIRQFNLISAPKLGGLNYKPLHAEKWPTARQAFKMERALLEYFGSRRHPSNREMITPINKDEFQSVWVSTYLKLRGR
jgi:hypothetical protein